MPTRELYVRRTQEQQLQGIEPPHWKTEDYCSRNWAVYIFYQFPCSANRQGAFPRGVSWTREAMKQRILGYRTPPCHRRPVIATQSSISSSYCALITTGMFLCVPAHRSALLTKHQYYSTSKSSTSSDPQHENLNFDIIAP